MSQPINFRRGTSADRFITTLGAGEPGWDTDTKKLYIGDGTTPGGIPIGGAPESTDYIFYVASSTYGGTAGGTGRALKTGVATGTTANKLVDSGGGFATAKHLNKTLYNTTNKSWAKITAVDSATQCSLSANIMTSGEGYVIADAVSTLAAAWALIPSPYFANITLLFTPETFSGDAEITGRIAAGSYLITLSCSGGITTFSGAITVRQKAKFLGQSAPNPMKFSGKVHARGGADITWDLCETTGKGRLYIYDTALNLIQNSTITVGNDPKNITKLNSTVNIGYTLYVASSTYGGSDTTGDGLTITSGTATSTMANKLVDSAASFTSEVAAMAIYNSTDGTWAKVNAVDSATQLSLSADIMANGEAYVISKAFATVQKAIDTIPGVVNCNTAVKVTPETFAENVIIQGKRTSGSYYINLDGTLTNTVSLRNVTAATYKTATVDGAALTVNAHIGQVLDVVAGPGAGQKGIVLSNTTNQFTIQGSWAGSSSGLLGPGVNAGTTITTASDVKVGDFATVLTSVRVTGGQPNVVMSSITSPFRVDSLSYGEAFGSKLTSDALSRYGYCLDGSKMDLIACYEPDNTTAARLTQYYSSCFGNIYNSWFKNRVAVGINSSVTFRASKTSDLPANISGLEAEGASIVALAFDANTENSFTGASGTGYDLNARNNCGLRGRTSAYNVYGTKNVDAATYSWES